MDAATASRLRSAAVCAGIGALFKVASTLVERRRLAREEPAAASLSVCGLQLRTKVGDLEHNLGAAAALILRHRGHDLFVLPELSSPGYGGETFARKDELAEDERSGPSFRRLSEVAQAVDAYVAYGILRRRRDGSLAISQAVVGPDGRLVTCYDKMHLCDMGACSEGALGVSAGPAEPAVFSCRGVTVGITICYDIRFPELWRDLAWKRGADVVIHPSAFVRDATFPSWHQFVCARAVENQIYVLSVSHAGDRFGSSIAHPPWLGPVGLDGGGRAVDLAPERADDVDEAVLVCRVDQDVLGAVRRDFPYRRDARRLPSYLLTRR